MKRPYILVIIGVVLILAAIVLNYMLTQTADEDLATTAEQAPPTVSSTEEPTPPAEPSDGSDPVAPKIKNPSFDVVRIGPDGNAVIAGRAEPNSKVRIREGEEVIGEATADERGEWVVLPGKPLTSGDRELSLEAEDDTGTVSKADDKIVVLIPDEAPKKNEAAEPTDAPAPATDMATADSSDTKDTGDAADTSADKKDQPIIALKVPNEGGAVTVMQGPAAEKTTEPKQDSKDAAEKMPRLSIGVVDYDTEGRVAMSGNADMDHDVQVYLDNKLVGTAPADENGNWALTIGEPIEPGNYTMRADQLDPAGKVTARVEIPFERARPEEILEPGSRYVVQPGNSLWRIARSTYGEGLKYWIIYAQNRKQIRDPDLIYPGQIFALPTTENAAE
ncbi:Ig-like domain-containing protein [Thalassospira lucentensis]|uniref:Peptidoglycan-binding protein n=1 Tax=Thalassospira lucentensis TaxID=168935 RepID=A0A358HN41_9PROT|nr:Ig-like domain-containing protein [Thalassospira lucentensis]HBU96422.1 peptidoglycan-binding protein [Thalassospira lucentensis]HCW67766.1 peptidoglycan-binding protein [Thalassospira lucentensis]